MSKEFVYLVQGKKSNVLKYGHLDSSNSDLVVLTYDEPISSSDCNCLMTIFFPKSTWAEGRNRQLEWVRNSGRGYTYYVFLDDDVEIKSGSFKEFEDLLIQHKPAVGLPLMHVIKDSHRYHKKLRIQHPVAMDQAFQAYHSNVISDGIVMPLVTQFDNESWWYSCEINSYLILSTYLGKVMQFNDIIVDNTEHVWEQSIENSSSRYKGGVTIDGLAKVKSFLVGKYGPQAALVNTLFHNPRYPSYSWRGFETTRNPLKLLKLLFRRWSNEWFNSSNVFRVTDIKSIDD